jgi:3-dehydroquinate synthase
LHEPRERRADSDARRLDVPSERGSYPVVIGHGAVEALPARLAERGLTGAVVAVSCPPVWRLHGARLRGVLKRAPPILIPDGERAKALGTIARIYDALTARRLDRSAVVVALGGGVVGDVAGFAAATYLRGLRLVQVPTSLVAQIDSAIGGKVGVNLPTGKNLVGAFHAPALVVCDPALMRSLPRREFRAGLYEAIKYGVIASRPLFDRLHDEHAAILRQQPETVLAIVTECCEIKAAIVGRDEREAGPRRALNFGHTIGHALEAATGYRRLRHGEAVAYGMIAAARLSAARGLLTAEDEQRIRAVVRHLGPLPAIGDLQIGTLLDAVSRDKKTIAGRLHFVLAAGIGKTTEATDVSRSELRQALRAIGVVRA